MKEGSLALTTKAKAQINLVREPNESRLQQETLIAMAVKGQEVYTEVFRKKRN